MTLTKEIWRKNWLNSINELTSSDLQKKSWLDNDNGNPHWSFIEFMNCYFDDLLCYDYSYYVENNWITEEEFELIKDWHQSLDNYKSPNNDDYNNESILNDIEWQTIIQKGLTAKNGLLKTISKAESKYLTDKIDYKKYN